MKHDERPDAAPPAPEEPSFGLDFSTPAAAAAKPAPYVVLARKYRPSSFADLIGQEAMVRTLTNAFEIGRIHQAYILTGVRGVGKTTTARILARAFNYTIPGKIDRPTIEMPELGVHCQAIIESRHVDVIEMDAASHTGIDDIREIIESSRYFPVSARIKVYIIDEVHMLSKSAFNGLLKTLEEPPPHVKFIFATTEIDKVPVTVRSRCQRFDLRRIEPEVMMAFLAKICAAENVTVGADSLALIARAAEGSVRDALSLTDQAIAHAAAGGGRAISIEAAALADMLGLADRARIIDLFEALMRGDIGAALSLLKAQHDSGADPAQVLVELADFVHLVTRFKLAPATVSDASVTPQERERGGAFAQSLDLRVLSRAWQMLLRGLQDVKDAPRPIAAADMVLVRIAHAADLPTVEDALKSMRGEPVSAAPSGPPAGAPPPRARPAASYSAASAQSPRPAPMASAARAPLAEANPQSEAHAVIGSLEDIVALADKHRDIQLKIALQRDVHLVRLEEGSLEFSLSEGASPQLAASLMRRLQEWTGKRWMVAISSRAGAPSLKEQETSAKKAQFSDLGEVPLVARVLAMFPGAEIVGLRSNEPEAPAPAPAAPQGGDDVLYADAFTTEDDDL